MATNLVSLVMQFLTPDMIGRIASALGFDRNTAQSTVAAAVPSLLAGLTGVASQPGGPQKLADAATQHSGALENFAGALGAGNQSSLIEQGSQMLSSLLGSRDLSSLAGAIGKYTGVGQGGISSLLGMLGPVVMGTIAQQPGATQPGRIASLLASQKDNITAAIPPGLNKQLSGTGLLDSLGGAARTAAATGSEWASSAARTTGDAVRTTATDVGRAPAPSNNWLYWLIPAAAIAALATYFLAKPAEHEQVAQDAGTVGQNVAVNATDVGRQVTDNLSNLHQTLSGITDPASAQAALPKLQEAAAQIDRVQNLNGRLSPEQRRVVAGLVSPVMPSINQLFDKVLAIPGVSSELKPAVDALKAKLAVFTT
jgi:hypothetical protein